MFSCVRVRRQLGVYLDGERSRNRRMAVERHLATCRSCRTALESLRRLERALQAVEVPPAGSDLTSRIMARARERQNISTEPSVIRLHHEVGSTSRTWTFRIAAAAVLVFGLTAGSYMGWSAGRSTAPAAQIDRLNAYNLDYLGDAPQGSLASSYLALASNREGY